MSFRCFRCDRDIRPYSMYLSIKGINLCEECAEPEYDYGCEGKHCYLCDEELDADDSQVVDVCDGDYICEECAHDNLTESDPEGDAADDWYEWSRDELR